MPAERVATLLRGDALAVLRTLPAKSFQCCITSPPYWGLRDYGTGTWEGGDPACPHAGRPKPRSNTTGAGEAHGRISTERGTQPAKAISGSPVLGECRCGARRVDLQIGLEPTPALYVARLVEVFAEVWRVLRDDGTLWLNLGDSYVSRDNGSIGTATTLQGSLAPHAEVRRAHGRRKRLIPDGLKHKDLAGMPWRVAFALQDAGWWLRSEVIWDKVNAMPESVKDRPTKAHETIFLLAKSETYYYDAEAVREADAGNGFAGRQGGATTAIEGGEGSREPFRAGAGRNLRSVWRFTTQPYPGAHFAAFPPELAERCIRAGSREGDAILDPFGGAGTAAMVALRLGRSATSIELSPAYVTLQERRIREDAPLLNRVEVAPWS